MQSGAGLAVGFDFVFGGPPEVGGALNDVEQDDEEDGKNGYGDKEFQEGKSRGFFRQDDRICRRGRRCRRGFFRQN